MTRSLRADNTGISTYHSPEIRRRSQRAGIVFRVGSIADACREIPRQANVRGIQKDQADRRDEDTRHSPESGDPIKTMPQRPDLARLGVIEERPFTTLPRSGRARVAMAGR